MNEPEPTRCPECGDARPSWRVKRDRALRHSRRELAWTCASCGHAWTEPLSINVVDALCEPRAAP